MSIAAWLNWAWMRRCGSELGAFHRATRNVAATQADVLQTIVTTNANTAFGRKHNFARIRSPQDFQSCVPLATYEELESWIRRASEGESDVLTREPIHIFQPTSGATSGEKMIPYTTSLKREFQRGIATWIGDLYSKRPAVRRGRAYWSISPALGDRRCTTGGIPIGFDDDASYLGTVEATASRFLMVAPPELSRTAEMPTFRYATLLYLLGARDLSLISVWNPSFLTMILAPLNECWEKACDDLRRGVICGTPQLPFRADGRRAAEVASICRSTRSHSERLQALWPDLALVSCWGDASASAPLIELRSLFPHVEFQPKGLLATEGFVSLPLCGSTGSALALRSHFLEFLPTEERHLDQASSITLLAHQLDIGGRYSVVITTGGGLYRYQLRDEIEVVGRLEQCPLVRFLGKSDCTCDLVGEKLSESFVRQAVLDACAAVACEPRFALLVPVEENPPRYRLLVQLDSTSEVDLFNLACKLETNLATNPYYRHAVGIGQLAAVEAALLDASCDAARIVADCKVSRGQRLGSIKPTYLDRWTGWGDLFVPHVRATDQANGRIQMLRQTSPAAGR